MQRSFSGSEFDDRTAHGPEGVPQPGRRGIGEDRPGRSAETRRHGLGRLQAGRFVFVIGNGGSGSNASHFCEDIGKGTLDREDFDNDAKKRLRILSLTDNTPYILAWGNDEGFDRVFVEQLKNLASPGDLLVAISGSRQQPEHPAGRRVGQPQRPRRRSAAPASPAASSRTLAQHSLHVPLDDMGIVESIHLTAFHWVVDDLYRRISM